MTIPQLYALPASYPLSLKQACLMLNEGYDAVYKKLKSGEYAIPHERRGKAGKIFIVKSDLMAWRTTKKVVFGSPTFDRAYNPQPAPEISVLKLMADPEIQREIREAKEKQERRRA